jgi:type VI secretion system secreted protein Hcp
MALNAYLTLKGQKQGDIKGSVAQKGYEGQIMVIAVDHELQLPHDPQSGAAIGPLTHQPFVITKEVDRATPLLYAMLVNHEITALWELRFYTPMAGTERQHYTVKLTNATIASIKFQMLNNKNPDFVRLSEFETIAFTYQNIEWIWTDGSIAAQDHWQATSSPG